MDKLQDEIDHLARELQDEAEEKEARAARLAKPESPKQRKKKRDPAEMTDAERARFDAQDRERWEASAGAIIDSDDVLALFARVWRKVVAGEEKNAKLLFLIGTSRLFKKCMSAAIKGPSSAGKSEIRRQVLEFFPPESVVSFTTLSEKALLYYQRDFAHKVLSMGEARASKSKHCKTTCCAS